MAWSHVVELSEQLLKGKGVDENVEFSVVMRLRMQG